MGSLVAHSFALGRQLRSTTPTASAEPPRQWALVRIVTVDLTHWTGGARIAKMASIRRARG
jgi:hypothetical protein